MVRKLLSQLQQLESDVLFDQDRADAQWPAMRSQIAQEKAAARQRAQMAIQQVDESKQKNLGTNHLEVSKEEPTLEGESFPEDEYGFMADMFSAIPERAATSDTMNNNTPVETISLRDFGKQSGLAPRKILEEAVRAR